MKLSHIALLMADSYKVSHKGFSPSGLTEIYANATPRFSHYFNEKYPDFDKKYVVFGTQYTAIRLKEVFDDFFDADKTEVISMIVKVLGPYIGVHAVPHFEQLHDLGYLPIEMKALEEGSIVDVGIPYMTFRNTHDDFQWITNYIESLISLISWKPMTVATVSRQFNKLSNLYADMTCDNRDHVPFQNHDFSMRGQSGLDSNTAVAMAWLTHSYGTDNILGVAGTYDYYYGDKCSFIAGSIPASEHSITGVNIINNNPTDLKAGEEKFLFDVLTDYYPTGLVASVFDTYDYWAALTEILPALKDKIKTRDGKLVVRPDSGDPVDMVCGTVNVLNYDNMAEAFADIKDTASDDIREGCKNDGSEFIESVEYVAYIKDIGLHYNVSVNATIGRERGGYTDNSYYYVDSIADPVFTEIELTHEQKGSIQIMWEIFGGTVNKKGYKVLDGHIGLIYGDGINYQRAKEIFDRLARKGFASSNVVYGIGSFSLNLLGRDDLGYAIKATHGRIDGKDIPIFKAPKTDASKKSAKGYLYVDETDGVFTLQDDVTFEKEQSLDNAMKVAFIDSIVTLHNSLDDLRTKLGTKTL